MQGTSLNSKSVKEYIFEKIGVVQRSDDKRQLPFIKALLGNLVLVILKLSSIIYGFIVVIRNFFYDGGIFKIHRLDCKVISIGNITVGGTGKTPAVISLGRYFINNGKKVCILLRGYKGNDEGVSQIISNPSHKNQSVNSASDEAMIIAKALPEAAVITGRDRVQSGRIALKEFAPDVIILDDAYQHRKVHRDMDILIMDYLKPFGNGWQLPGGILRESPKNVNRADINIFTRGDDVTREMFRQPVKYSSNKDVKMSVASHIPKKIIKVPENESISLEDASKMEFLSFSGIARPDSFEESLKSLNLRICDHVVFHDHHKYGKKSYERIINRAKELKLKGLITTEKDQVKIDPSFLDGFELYYLVIQFEFNNGFPGWKELINS